MGPKNTQKKRNTGIKLKKKKKKKKKKGQTDPCPALVLRKK